jgi:type II restriction/modification system DNA methylase subunit YeeA
MNTKHLKAYAPKARRQFIEAVQKRAAHFGIYPDNIAQMQAQGSSVVIEGRVFTKLQGQQRNRLVKRVEERGYEMFTREMAYTWFNRFAAIRYMELHDYLEHGYRVLSSVKNHPSSSDGLPEILGHASDVADLLELDKSHITELQLAGDKEETLYRELLLGQCHQLAKIMPFVFKGIGFEATDNATELLLPDNLTKTDSILKGLVNDIPEEDWQEIEVIGWLYQFYISEHKDTVIGKVVKSEDIPAATQLFTPNWIVKYLVQNSLGRQWLATYPESELKSKMEYYIEPTEQSDDVIEQLKTITPSSIDPEQIKVLDPAAGSGHILVEVYEVLREIYLERGYRLREIPALILTKNIYGLDIDDRAAQLAGFALMMKAREDDRRIFQRVEDGEVALNVCAIHSTENLNIPKLWAALDLEDKHQKGITNGLFDHFDHRDKFEHVNEESLTELSIPAQGAIYSQYYVLLQMLKSAFLQAKTLGSLIKIDTNHLVNLVALKGLLQLKEKGSDPSSKLAARDVLPIVSQAITLAQQYEVVVANPPYMGSKYQTPVVKEYLKDNFCGYEKDLFSAFIVRNLQLTKYRGELGFMTPFVWMFISSYEELRSKLINEEVLSTLIQLEYSGFDGATVPICTFTVTKGHVDDYVGSYVRLSKFKGAANQGPKTLEAISNRECDWFFDAKPDDFKKIPGNPIAYWATDNDRAAFIEGNTLEDIAPPRLGMATGHNDTYLRLWHEVSINKSGFNFSSRDSARESMKKWFPYNKGGDYRRWYGNCEYLVNWENDGQKLQTTMHSSGSRLWAHNFNLDYIFKPSITWTATSSSYFAVRQSDQGFLFDVKGSSCFPKDGKEHLVLGFLCSSATQHFMTILNPTIEFQPGNIASLCLPVNKFKDSIKKVEDVVIEAVQLARSDWDRYETSWNFKKSPLVNNTKKFSTIVNSHIEELNEKTDRLHHLEYLNNKNFTEIIGLDEYLAEKVDKRLVTLKGNPAYRFKKSADETEQIHMLTSSLISEFLSYTVACMMGRFSLDYEGLVYAHSGNEGFKELVGEGAYQTFPADDDGIIPLASEDWLFDDDATTRFKDFVKTVWYEEHLNENLEFVAESLCLHALKPKKGEDAMDNIRRYFSHQFFKDHCKTYKKRPIYWLFSSGKEKAFECLVYLHRYNESTLSRMRTECVTPLIGKYDAQRTLLSEQLINATGTEQRSLDKDLKSLTKKQAELRTFDEQLKHYAEMRITLDLDDGVKENYGKFGNLLADVKTIHGKAVK